MGTAGSPVATVVTEGSFCFCYWLLVLGSVICYVRVSWLLVIGSCSWLLVLDFRLSVLGYWFLICVSWFLVRGSWFLSWLLVIGSWFLDLGSDLDCSLL